MAKMNPVIYPVIARPTTDGFPMLDIADGVMYVTGGSMKWFPAANVEITRLEKIMRFGLVKRVHVYQFVCYVADSKKMFTSWVPMRKYTYVDDSRNAVLTSFQREYKSLIAHEPDINQHSDPNVLLDIDVSTLDLLETDTYERLGKDHLYSAYRIYDYVGNDLYLCNIIFARDEDGSARPGTDLEYMQTFSDVNILPENLRNIHLSVVLPKQEEEKLYTVSSCRKIALLSCLCGMTVGSLVAR